MKELDLHDIKALVQIPDLSIYLFSVLLLLIFIFIFTLLFLLYKLYKNKKNINKTKQYYNILKNIDFSNSKEAAYCITKYARLLANSSNQKVLADDLIENLEKYKYKKQVDEISQEVKIVFYRFMDSIDV